MGKNKLWNIRIEEQLIDRLGRLGERLGYPSGNAFVADALDQYAELLADLLAEVREDREATRKRQRERLLAAQSAARRK